MQSPTTPTEWSAEILARLSSVAWFDWTALAVIFVFLALGLARGMRWQLTRLLGLLAAYAAAIVAGSPLTAMLPAGVVGRPPSPMALHVVQVVLFVAVLVVLGLVFHLARRLVIPAEPTFAGRAVAGAVGLVSGALWTLALITAFQLVLDGWSVASAAKASRSADYGRRALRFASEPAAAQLTINGRKVEQGYSAHFAPELALTVRAELAGWEPAELRGKASSMQSGKVLLTL